MVTFPARAGGVGTVNAVPEAWGSLVLSIGVGGLSVLLRLVNTAGRDCDGLTVSSSDLYMKQAVGDHITAAVLMTPRTVHQTLATL